jgi:hypothetical protein
VAPVRADVSQATASIFMVSGWLGKGHGTLLKNSFALSCTSGSEAEYVVFVVF